jgi:Tfp pilus assembly protein PilZ
MKMPAKTDPLKSRQEEQREAFRINDTLAVIVRKIEEDTCFSEPGTTDDGPPEIVPSVLEKENISPRLWEMLVNLNRKLDRVLEKIPVDLFSTKPQPANLSSTGMKVKVKKKFSLDEPVRIKLLLPTLPVKELVVDGKVVWVETLPDGEFEVGLQFRELDDTVKDEIIHYTLNQQRKIIAAQRQKRGQDESDKE